MIFTVELKGADADGAQVENYLDEAGLQDLVTQLGFLKAEGDHCHIFTERWGGQLLGQAAVGEGKIINMLTIIRT